MEGGSVSLTREQRPRKLKRDVLILLSIVVALSPLVIEGTWLHLFLIACGWLAVIVGAFYLVKHQAWWLLASVPILCVTVLISSFNHAIYAHVGHPPPIAQAIDFATNGRRVPDAEWTATLRGHFPSGTSETNVVTTLRAQGFLIDQRKHVAHNEWSEPFCRVIIEAQWTTNSDQRIAHIEGDSEAMCL